MNERLALNCFSPVQTAGASAEAAGVDALGG
jgi:hypothetical protein